MALAHCADQVGDQRGALYAQHLGQFANGALAFFRRGCQPTADLGDKLVGYGRLHGWIPGRCLGQESIHESFSGFVSALSAASDGVLGFFEQRNGKDVETSTARGAAVRIKEGSQRKGTAVLGQGLSRAVERFLQTLPQRPIDEAEDGFEQITRKIG